jgi:hypothetical protein
MSKEEIRIFITDKGTVKPGFVILYQKEFQVYRINLDTNQVTLHEDIENCKELIDTELEPSYDVINYDWFNVQICSVCEGFGCSILCNWDRIIMNYE